MDNLIMVRVLYRGESINLSFWDEFSAREYLKKHAQAYHYEPEAFTFENFDVFEEIEKMAESD